MLLRFAIRILLGIALLVIGYWTLLFFAQRRIMYPAPSAAGAPPRPADAEQIWLEANGTQTEAWYLPPLVSRAGPAPLLIFTHGNGELIDYWPSLFAEPRQWGMAVLLVEYPGYGRSSGSPSRASIEAAVQAAHEWASNHPGIDRNRIVAYGRSLGGGAAAVLATSREVSALILESTFTSPRAFAPGMGAPGFLVRDNFDNLATVKTFKKPILILHGQLDQIIPIAHGQALAEAAGVELLTMPCGHNDCPRQWAAIRAFLLQHHIL